MIRLTIATLILISSVLPALAADAVCRPSPSRTIDVFQDAKDAFLRGEFDLFYDTVTPFGGARDRETFNDLARLTNSFPNGFRECATVVQRREAPGFFQEVVLFDTGARPVALYLQGAEFRRGSIVTGFALSEDIAGIIDQLR